MSSSSSSSSSSLGASGGIGGSSGTTGSTAALGVAPLVGPPRSIAIDWNALGRGVAIQRYFNRLFTDILLPEYAPLLSVDGVVIPEDNVVLSECCNTTITRIKV